jgi:hypothetical protein
MFIFHQISYNLKTCAGRIKNINEYASYLDFLTKKNEVSELSEKFNNFKND